MSTFRGNLGMSFTGDDDREHSTPPLTSLQQNVPITESSLYWTDEAHQGSFVPDGDAPNMNSWPNTTFADPSFTGYGDQYLGEVHSEPHFLPRDDSEQLWMDLMRMEVAGPVSEPVFAAPQALPVFHPCSSSLTQWNRESNPQLQSPPLDHPALHSMQPVDCGSFTDSVGMRPTSISAPQPITSSMFAGHSEGRVVTGHPSIATTSTVQHFANSDPVSVRPSTPRPRGERWDRPGAKTFQCLWKSHEKLCLALIAGNRKSVTNHLRDAHDFTCDSQLVPCLWDFCMTSMQRRNIPRHIVACHFAIKVPCTRCGMPLSRADANRKHQLACPGSTPSVIEATEEDASVYSGGVGARHTE